MALQVVSHVTTASSSDAHAARDSASHNVRQAQFIASMQQHLGWTPSNIVVTVKEAPPPDSSGLPVQWIVALVGGAGAIAASIAFFAGYLAYKRWHWRRLGIVDIRSKPPQSPQPAADVYSPGDAQASTAAAGAAGSAASLRRYYSVRVAEPQPAGSRPAAERRRTYCAGEFPPLGSGTGAKERPRAPPTLPRVTS